MVARFPNQHFFIADQPRAAQARCGVDLWLASLWKLPCNQCLEAALSLAPTVVFLSYASVYETTCGRGKGRGGGEKGVVDSLLPEALFRHHRPRQATLVCDFRCEKLPVGSGPSKQGHICRTAPRKGACSGRAAHSPSPRPQWRLVFGLLLADGRVWAAVDHRGWARVSGKPEAEWGSLRSCSYCPHAPPPYPRPSRGARLRPCPPSPSPSSPPPLPPHRLVCGGLSAPSWHLHTAPLLHPSRHARRGAGEGE
jgi:hypothetical protein